jgi:hypothetical protein
MKVSSVCLLPIATIALEVTGSDLRVVTALFRGAEAATSAAIAACPQKQIELEGFGKR